MPLKIIRNDIAIYEASGAEKLLAERKKIGCIKRGEVAVTKAFVLDAKYIIHTVSPVWQGGDNEEFAILRRCYMNSLRKAADLGCESIAFPLIATGVYGFPKDKALQIAISEISDFLLQCEMMIYLVVFDDTSFQLSSQVMENVQSFIDANYVKTARHYEYGSRGPFARDRRRECEDIELFERSIQYSENKRVTQTEPVVLARTIAPNYTLDDQFANMGGTFQEKLFELIEDRGLSNVEVYTRANLDRKHFSKIQCNVNYYPSKKTAMALCIALQLDLDESKDLLARAEWAFSPNRKSYAGLGKEISACRIWRKL